MNIRKNFLSRTHVKYVLNNNRVVGCFIFDYVTIIRNNHPTNFPIPRFDEWGIFYYPNEVSLFEIIPTKFNKDRNYLSPIPQT